MRSLENLKAFLHAPAYRSKQSTNGLAILTHLQTPSNVNSIRSQAYSAPHRLYIILDTYYRRPAANSIAKALEAR